MIMNLHSDIGHLPNERTVCSPSPPGPRTVSGLEERVPGKVSRLEPLNCLARVAQISNLCIPKAFGAGRRASSLRDLRTIQRAGGSTGLPIGNRRYSRLEICATRFMGAVNAPILNSIAMVRRSLSSAAFTLIELLVVI